MIEPKSDKTRKDDRARKGTKGQKVDVSKGTEGRKPPATHETISQVLTAALRGFPNVCAEKCGSDKCDKMECDAGRKKLLDFEDSFKPRLLVGMKQAKEKEQNLLHRLVGEQKQDSPPEGPPKRLFDWMLRQQWPLLGNEPILLTLLTLRDNRGSTPVHSALYDKFDGFVHSILGADKLKIINILKVTFNSKNCIHIATEQGSRHLELMVSKCIGDKEILLSGARAEEGTPLHIAVQDLSMSVSDTLDNVSEPDIHNNTPSERDAESDDGREGLAIDYESRFEILNDPEERRRRRLQRLLDDLDNKEPAKPSPLQVNQNTTPGTHLDAQIAGNDQLPPGHCVCLLVRACPDVLKTKNKDKRTPYQEREHVLLKDEYVKRLVEQYARRVVREGETPEIREARAKRAIIEADPVAHYLRSYCIRSSLSREDMMQQLYMPGQERLIEFDLVGFPSSSLKHNYLSKLGAHVQFESILRYVALPALSVDPPPSRNPRLIPETSAEESHRIGRSDLVKVFDWLWRKGVREIVKVKIVDSVDLPHTDASIIKALYGFNVRVWDWNKMDICSNVIHESSPVIEEITVYASGNNAVLMGWGSEEGLGDRKKFPHLRTVNLLYRNTLRNDTRWQSDIKHCQDKVTAHWKREHDNRTISFKRIPYDNQGTSTTEDIEESPAWLESAKQFAGFIHNASTHQAGDERVSPVKIAIIDDGIDVTSHLLESKIAGGATFCPYPRSKELVNSYFVPRGKHGTMMAQVICQLCPAVQLYIARLEELPLLSGSGRRVTAKSAAKAVEWAVDCGVDIISMSWTIQTDAKEDADIKSLQAAFTRANQKDIHLFGSAHDQGAHTKEDYLPSMQDCIRIGGATFTGEKLTWVDDRVDFWFPGRNVPFPQDDKSVLYETGSSIATAMASGLAGLLILAARVSNMACGKKYENRNHPFHSRDSMKAAFETMSTGADNRFPRTDDFLNKRFKRKIDLELQAKQQATAEARLYMTRTTDIKHLKWDDVSKKALEDLLLRISG